MDTRVNSTPGIVGLFTAIKRPEVLIILSINFILLAYLAFLTYRLGSVEAAIDYVRGHRLLVLHRVASFGTAPQGAKVTNVTFDLVNVGNESLRVVGARSPCSCTVPPEMPFAMGPRTRRTMKFEISLDRMPVGKFHMDLALFTTLKGQREIPIVIEGDVITHYSH